MFILELMLMFAACRQSWSCKNVMFSKREKLFFVKTQLFEELMHTYVHFIDSCFLLLELLIITSIKFYWDKIKSFILSLNTISEE